MMREVFVNRNNDWQSKQGYFIRWDFRQGPERIFSLGDLNHLCSPSTSADQLPDKTHCIYAREGHWRQVTSASAKYVDTHGPI